MSDEVVHFIPRPIALDDHIYSSSNTYLGRVVAIGPRVLAYEDSLDGGGLKIDFVSNVHVKAAPESRVRPRGATT